MSIDMDVDGTPVDTSCDNMSNEGFVASFGIKDNGQSLDFIENLMPDECAAMLTR